MLITSAVENRQQLFDVLHSISKIDNCDSDDTLGRAPAISNFSLLIIYGMDIHSFWLEIGRISAERRRNFHTVYIKTMRWNEWSPTSDPTPRFTGFTVDAYSVDENGFDKPIGCIHVYEDGRVRTLNSTRTKAWDVSLPDELVKHDLTKNRHTSQNWLGHLDGHDDSEVHWFRQLNPDSVAYAQSNKYHVILVSLRSRFVHTIILIYWYSNEREHIFSFHDRG